MKILNIVGTRPNFMKIAPILKAMEAEDNMEPILLHTGQHYNENLSQFFFEELGIRKPDINLNVGSHSHAKQVAKIMSSFDDITDEIKPDLVLVVGDVNSTLACTLVAAKKGIKVLHVEAGIRSGDRTMPEEINRLATDAVADYLLPPSADAVENLKNEGHTDDKICLVGNIMIDTLKMNQPQIQASTIMQDLKIEKGKFATLTLHRPSNVDNEDSFRRILSAIEVIQKSVKLVFPIHPRTNNMIDKLGLRDEIKTMDNLILTEPLGYFDFGNLISNSQFVLTDSGGIQEETTVYGIPCITLRENTERPITITEGTNELAGSDNEKIISFADKILSGEWKKGRVPELWDGNTAKRIVEFIKGLEYS